MKKAVSRLILLTAAIALALPAIAQQPENHPPNNNALALLLQSKGILSSAEVATINQAASPEQANARLAQLLIEKGLISSKEYSATVSPASAVTSASAVTPVSMEAPTVHLSNAVLQSQNPPQSGQTPTGTPPTPERPGIAAVAPLRVLPIDIPKQGGMIPDIHLGSGANIKLYGFYKASAISDTASSGGATFGSQDWPLPLLLGDTATATPTTNPQVHLKARSFRMGMQTEWVPKNSDFTITARVEGDFEGDYTDVSNRNISSVRSNQFALRLAWMRLDHKIGGLPWFAEFGQDWSLLGSSTLPALFETTGLGVGMGGFYERIPQFKTGVQFHAGDLKIQPEVALVLSAGGTSGLTTDQHLRFGDAVGAESDQPGVEGRVVFQFPLSHNWRGVVPAQLIVSGHHSRMSEVIPHAAQVVSETTPTCLLLPCPVTVFNSTTVPNVGYSTTTNIVGASNCTEASGTCTLEQLFPMGSQSGNAQNAYSAEIQLPTPWVTFDAKFYRGSDLRFFFGGQLNDVYSNLLGMTEVGSGISESGRAILFGCYGGTTAGQPAETINCQGNPVAAAKLQPVGGSGGFAEMSFPLSRIFHAEPESKNSGWVLHLMWGTDRANYAEASHGNHLGRTDLDTASLTYRLNKWVTFVHEASYIVTFTANNHAASGAITPEYLLFGPTLTRQAHNWRNEFGPVFTF
jgi:hypothetical protein